MSFRIFLRFLAAASFTGVLLGTVRSHNNLRLHQFRRKLVVLQHRPFGLKTRATKQVSTSRTVLDRDS